MYRKLKCFFSKIDALRNGATARFFFESSPTAFWTLVESADPIGRYDMCNIRVLELREISYAVFEDIRHDFIDENFGEKWEDIQSVLERSTNRKVDFSDFNAFVVIGLMSKVYENLKKASELEKTHIEADTHWIAAGGDRLRKYRHLPSLIYLAETFGVLPDRIGELAWLKVFLYLGVKKEQAEIMKKYQELKQKSI